MSKLEDDTDHLWVAPGSLAQVEPPEKINKLEDDTDHLWFPPGSFGQTQSLAQDDEPEKVSVLDPQTYQDRANKNKPAPRTTWYDKKVHSQDYYEKKQKSKALAQEQDPKFGPGEDPEKVNVLEPEVYQERANKNKPGPRTTFYNKNKKEPV